MKILNLFVLFGIFSFYSCVNANSKPEPIFAELTEVTEQPNHDDTPKIQVALLLDTSNSMDGLIDQARAQLWDIINELSLSKCHGKQPSLDIALYEYGNDNLSEYDGYTHKILNFTTDLDEVSKALFSLTTNGGSEYCGTVVKSASKELQWEKDKETLKLMFIAGNEAYTQGPNSYIDASQNAKEHGITVNTIFCGNYQQGITSKWRDGALLTDGDYMAIDHNKAIVHVASPYDDEIMQLNSRLNKTYVPYGRQGQSKVAVQMEQDNNAMGYSQESAVKRAVSKSSYLYNNKSWDLVDAVNDNEAALEEVVETQLPQELKGKSKKEIANFIAEKSKERERLQENIQQLNTKRKNYVAKLQQNSKDKSLQSAMLKAIKEQADLKGFEW